jgi:hypothetical protein
LVEGSFEMMVIFSGVLIEFLWWWFGSGLGVGSWAVNLKKDIYGKFTGIPTFPQTKKSTFWTFRKPQSSNHNYSVHQTPKPQSIFCNIILKKFKSMSKPMRDLQKPLIMLCDLENRSKVFITVLSFRSVIIFSSK